MGNRKIVIFNLCNIILIGGGDIIELVQVAHNCDLGRGWFQNCD